MCSGGARSKNHRHWAENAIRNNDYFIDKNYDSMQKMFSLPRTKDEMKALFRVQIKSRYAKSISWIFGKDRIV